MAKEKKEKVKKGSVASLFDDMSDGYGSFAEHGIVGDSTGYIHTGCYMLNAALSANIFGGVSNSKITVFAGEPATGKTFFVLTICAEFLKQNPKGFVLYYDTEGAVTRQMLVNFGIDLKRFFVKVVATVQEFKTSSTNFVQGYEAIPEEERTPVMIALDSIGMLATTKEVTDAVSGEDKTDMTRAKLIRSAFRILTPKLAKLHIPLLATNHVHADIGSFVGGSKQGGGLGAVYSASNIIFLSKAQLKEGSGENKELKGSIITCTVVKSRFSKEKSKCKVELRFDTGLRLYSGLLDLALKYGVATQRASKGIVYSLYGSEEFNAKKLQSEPEKIFTPEVLERMQELVTKEFAFGSGGPPPEEEVDEVEESDE